MIFQRLHRHQCWFFATLSDTSSLLSVLCATQHELSELMLCLCNIVGPIPRLWSYSSAHYSPVFSGTKRLERIQEIIVSRLIDFGSSSFVEFRHPIAAGYQLDAKIRILHYSSHDIPYHLVNQQADYPVSPSSPIS